MLSWVLAAGGQKYKSERASEFNGYKAEEKAPTSEGGRYKTVAIRCCNLLGVAEGVQVDAELLAFFVEVAALEA